MTARSAFQTKNAPGVPERFCLWANLSELQCALTVACVAPGGLVEVVFPDGVDPAVPGKCEVTQGVEKPFVPGGGDFAELAPGNGEAS